ncbi:hypothetical protein SM124_17560 [Bacillus sp. 31A1R]|uniref:Uncharacterized protein n=1 Tax=Robertmurraya mangrovi TaxID=3098077 RepID=A0ABU5J281_9BACI|nr:hypothetical protein [Bacillus sp. 31A1R]MDZ5473525.1 hypothetical protein [Bacillus sp. 31A1R]
MYRKDCDKCLRSSYSSSEFGEWACPICGNDLTNHPFFDAITFERIHVNMSSKKLKMYKQKDKFVND